MTTVTRPLAGERLQLILDARAAARDVGLTTETIVPLCEEGELECAPTNTSSGGGSTPSPCSPGSAWRSNGPPSWKSNPAIRLDRRCRLHLNLSGSRDLGILTQHAYDLNTQGKLFGPLPAE
jgi:hypothetical protein